MVNQLVFRHGKYWIFNLPRFTIGFLDNRPRPKLSVVGNFASNCVQNSAIWGLISRWEASKADCINRVYGAGDGNRTHVRNLGSLNIPIPFSSERHAAAALVRVPFARIELPPERCFRPPGGRCR